MTLPAADNLIERLRDPADKPVCAAPLAGWTDLAYRRILKSCGVRHSWIPFVSSHAIVSGDSEKDIFIRELSLEPSHVQIFGNNPQINATAAKIIEQAGALSIDFNAGCSVRKVHKGGGGSALLKDIDLLTENLKSVKEAVKIPVSMKTRAGFYASDRSGMEACRIAQDLGFDFVTLHPRFAKQLFGGKAEWNLIAELADSLDIPVIGNGDIETPDDAKRMFEETGCAGVMIGRAIMGDPWLISDCEMYLQNGSPRALRTRREIVDAMLEHYDFILESSGETQGALEFRKHIAKYLRGFAQASKLRNVLVRLDNPYEVKRMLDEFGDGKPPGAIIGEYSDN
ncbi:MAG TPA: hypothetical protein ENN67_01685 [Firmicutes bacterium]|nr:hypothetical protein [Bacillota bacterium]